MTDVPPDAPVSKVTRARAVTVGAADPSKPRRRITRPDAAAEAAAPAPPAPVSATAAMPVEEPSAAAIVERLAVQQGGLAQAQAVAIDVHQGGIGMADATDIAVSQGGIGIARGDRVSVEMGAVGLTIAGEARLSQGVAQTIIAREATFEQGLLGTVIAERVTVRQPAFVGIILANRVDGEVRALLDWRGALAAGAVIGLVLGILRRR
jgi:hypothetical protein